MRVAEAVGQGLAKLGADTVFGVVGSGNFHVTNALIAGGARFIAARHEGGATVMADAWARTTGRPGMVSVHQGPGLTNAMTGIAEAAKSRTPLLVLAAEAPEVRSNFHVDVAGLAAAVGAVAERIYSPASALADAARAYQTALGRRTVILALPLNVQGAPWEAGSVQAPPRTYPPGPSPEAVTALAALLRGCERPVFIAGRGARGPGARPGSLVSARAELERLADACGALLATSAVAKGLFRGNPWSLDVSGGFASPLAAELITGADVIVGWGCSLNMWTMRHGKLIGTGATLIQVDDDAGALGAHRPVHLGVLGDVAETARAVADALADGRDGDDEGGEPPTVRNKKDNGGAPGAAGTRGEAGHGPPGAAGTRGEAGHGPPGAAGTRGEAGHGAPGAAGTRGERGYRSADLRERIAREVRWRDVPFADESDGDRIDPRALSIALDDLLPAELAVAVDSGNFMGYPSMYLSVPDEVGFCFTQASIQIHLAGLVHHAHAAVAELAEDLVAGNRRRRQDGCAPAVRADLVTLEPGRSLREGTAALGKGAPGRGRARRVGLRHGSPPWQPGEPEGVSPRGRVASGER